MTSLQDRVIGDFYKFRTDYGGYTVYFENLKYTKKEVKRLFSRYGQVKKITHSDVYLRNHCFVTFGSEDDVIRCIESLNSTSEITLLTITRGRIAPEYPARNKTQRVAEVKSNKPTILALESSESIVLQNDKTASRRSKLTTAQKSKVAKPKPSASVLQNAVNSAASVQYFALMQEKMRAEMIKSLMRLLDDLPEVVQQVTVICDDGELGESFYVPLKSRVSWKNLRGVIADDIAAHPVVVANIHDICGADFVMDLLEQYQPLVSSKIKVVPGTSLRFCCVYFRNALYARAVERIYDTMEILGSNLIVLRSETLAALKFNF